MRFLATTLFLLFSPATLAQGLPIGHVQLPLVDPARGPRSVPAEVYYPATAAGESTPVAGAPGATYPVVSVGHGFLLSVARYQWLWQELVPQGYIVVLPATETGLTPSHQALALDLMFVLDEMAAQGASPTSMFSGKVGAAAAVMGHSMGGGAAVLAASQRSSLAAVVTFAAADTNPSAIAVAASATSPALTLAAAADCVAPPGVHQQPIHTAFGSVCKQLVTLTGASHCQFAASDTICSLGELACTPPSLSRAQQQSLALDLVRPWLDWHVKGDTAARASFEATLAGGAGFNHSGSCPPPPARACGDCDDDGRIDITDALAAARHDVGLALLSGADFDACDVDSSTRVTVLDAYRIAVVAVGLPMALICP